LPAKQGQHNIAFTCFHQLGDTAACIDLLIKTDRAPEAAFFARSYAPSSAGGKKKLADALADPQDNEELFDEGWAQALAKEQGGSGESESVVSGQNGASTSATSAQTVTETVTDGAEVVKDTVVDLAEKVKEVVIDAVEPTEADGKQAQRSGR
jgi:coatomer subunit beta'